MKKMKKLITILSITICLIAPISLLSQDVPPPPPAGGHGESGNQESGAPIGGGLFILLGLGGIYGGYKRIKDYKKIKKV